MEDLDHMLVDEEAPQHDHEASAGHAAQPPAPPAAAAHAGGSFRPAAAPAAAWARGNNHAAPAKRSSRAPVIDVLMLGDGLGSASAEDFSGDEAAEDGTEQQGQLAAADADLLDADEAVQADFGLSAADVVARIEEFVSSSIEALAQGQLPVLELVSRAVSNVRMVDDDGADVANGRRGQLLGSYRGGSLDEDDTQEQEEDVDAEGTQQRRRQQQQQQQQRLQLGGRMQTKTLLHSAGAQAAGIARVFRVLEAVHALLRAGKQATQRDLYYSLKLQGALFSSPSDVSSAIQDAVALLRVPRSSLGICCASRGSVAGRLMVREGPAGAWQDCAAAGMAGKAVPGEVGAIMGWSFRCTARYILIIEKDAVFQRLTQDRLWETLPAVLVTAKGFPDLATRVLLSRLAEAFPAVPLLGLADWNPAGVGLLATYKYGNQRMGLEAPRYALPSLCWLGVHSDMLADVPASAFQPLTARDKALLPGLRTRLAGSPDWVLELDEMEEAGLKADIEALYSVMGVGGLRDALVRRVLQQGFLA